MTLPVLYAIVESPAHPEFADLYAQCGFQTLRFTSMRQAMAELKRTPPAVVVAEFFYGWGNNYAGVNISNLDVLLYSLQKYAPQAKVIAMVEKAERQYVDKLNAILPLHGVLIQPVAREAMEALLRN